MRQLDSISVLDGRDVSHWVFCVGGSQLWKGEGDLVLYYATQAALADPSTHRDEPSSASTAATGASAPAVGA